LLVLTTTNAYDTHGRLKGIAQRNSTGIIAQSTYDYDKLNRLTATTKNGQTQTYDYDSTDQVQTVTGSNSEAYTYDRNGNRINSGYITDAGNRLRSDGTYNYEYDSEGNRTIRTKIADGTVDTYRWDYRNRLMGIVSKDINGVVTRTVGYTYDVDDQRVSKTVDGVVENYYLDGNQIAFVTDGDGDETFHYLYGLNVDQVLAQDSSTGMVWALADRLGSVDTITDADGHVVESRTYDSFGNLLSTTPNSQLPAPNFRYGYTGRELDAESGLDYYRARYYDSAVGRFISVDPMGFGAGDTNLYRYVGNNSTNATDPSGMISWNDVQQGAANISQTVQDAAYGWLVNTDKAYAGFAGFITGGYTNQLRNEVYGDKVAGQNEGWIYNLGQVAGFGVTAVLSFLAPGALVGRITAAERVAQGYTVAQTGIGAFNTTTKIQAGQMDWSSPWSYVETAASFAPLFGTAARQFGRIGVVENALSKATAVGGDIWNGAGQKVSNYLDKATSPFKTFKEDWTQIWNSTSKESSKLNWIKNIQKETGIENIKNVAGNQGIGRIDILAKDGNSAKRVRIMMKEEFHYPGDVGITDMYGNVMIDVSQYGVSPLRIQQTILHEDFHSFLAPYHNSPFARFRTTVATYGYDKIQLLRWAEEAGAEAYSLIKTRKMGDSTTKITDALNEARKFPLTGYSINGATVGKQFAALTTLTGSAFYSSYEYGKTLSNK
jgi:RHS repeat-associated protein